MTASKASKMLTLHQIAAALGVPVERFFSGQSSYEEPDGARECLRLWSMIKTDGGRVQALEALRAVAAAEEALP